MVLPRPVYLTRPGKFVVGSRAGRILDVAAPEYPHQLSVVPRSPDIPSRLDHAGYPTGQTLLPYTLPSPWEWVGALDLTSIDLEKLEGGS